MDNVTVDHLINHGTVLGGLYCRRDGTVVKMDKTVQTFCAGFLKSDSDAILSERIPHQTIELLIEGIDEGENVSDQLMILT